jgi:PKD repeat protein
MKKSLLSLLIALLLSSFTTFSQVNVTNYAGALNTQGSVDGTLTTARFGGPAYIAFDKHGNMFIADAPNNCIRKIDTNGNVSTYAGTTSSGFVNGTLADARFHGPIGLAFDSIGNLYIGDSGNNCIRRIDTIGMVSTYAGSQTAGYVNSTNPLNARFRNPNGICFDKNWNLLIADPFNHCIRMINPQGEVTTLAGTGTSGYLDGPNTSALFRVPIDVKVDRFNNVYVTEPQNSTVRKISGGMVSTFAGDNVSGYVDGTGTAARFAQPYFLEQHQNGHLFIADQQNWVIRSISPAGVVTTLAGTGTYGTNNGNGTTATFTNVSGMAIGPDGALYIADYNARVIRKLAVPTPTATVPPFTCKGSTASLTASGGTGYRWYGSQNSSFLWSNTANFTTPAIQNITTYYLANFFRGLESTRIPVTITPEDFQLSFNFSDCDLGNPLKAEFTNTTPNNTAYTFSWNFGNGQNSTQVSPSHNYSSTGTYTITLTATDPITQCTDILSQQVKVLPALVLNFTSPSKACKGANTAFINTTTGGGSNTYAWDFGNGNQASGYNGMSNYNQAGNFTIKLIATTENGCTQEFSQSLQVVDNPVAAFAVQDACQGAAASITNNSSGPGPLSFQWQFGNGFSSTLANPNHPYNTEGEYLITLVATSPDGCKDTIVHAIEVYPSPIVDFSFNNNACICNTVEFTNLSSISSGESLSFLWETSNPSSPSTAVNLNQQFCTTGANNIKLATTSARGCSSEKSAILNIWQPDAGFSAQAITLNKYYFVPANVSAAEYLWNFGDGNTSTLKKPEHIFAANGTYTVSLTIKDVFGCEETTTQQVTITELSVFNAGFVNNMKVYPNPYQGQTEILVELENEQNLQLEVYSIEGRLVAVLADGPFKGTQRFKFSARERGYNAGVYYIRASSSNFSKTIKIIEL